MFVAPFFATRAVPRSLCLLQFWIGVLLVLYYDALYFMESTNKALLSIFSAKRKKEKYFLHFLESVLKSFLGSNKKIINLQNICSTIFSHQSSPKFILRLAELDWSDIGILLRRNIFYRLHN